MVNAGTQRIVTVAIAPSALADVEHLASTGHEPHRAHLRGEVPEAAAGAVRGRRDRAGQRLGIHVALVLHGQPARPQLLPEVVQRNAGLHRHLAALDRQHPPHRRHVDHDAVGACDVGERVPRPGHLDPPSAGHRAD
jgi:hypothetical protein